MEEEILSAARRRGWLVGLLFGLLGGLVSGVVGTFSGLCCLFQFANALTPIAVGLVGGGVTAAMANWAELPAGQGTSLGAGLGLRGGGFGAFVAGCIGFLCALLFPIASLCIGAFQSDADAATMVAGGIASLAMTAGMGFLFTGVGVVGGLVAGAGAGAVAGMVRGRP